MRTYVNRTEGSNPEFSALRRERSHSVKSPRISRRVRGEGFGLIKSGLRGKSGAPRVDPTDHAPGPVTLTYGSRRNPLYSQLLVVIGNCRGLTPHSKCLTCHCNLPPQNIDDFTHPLPFLPPNTILTVNHKLHELIKLRNCKIVILRRFKWIQ